MALRLLAAALGMIVAASPLSAALPIPAREAAPAGTETTRYCLRVEPITGSRIETIECRTRDEWTALDVELDQEWPDNGVRVI